MAKKKVKQISGEIEVCCHTVEWYYDIIGFKMTPEVEQELEKLLAEEAEYRAKDVINDNCSAGELVCSYVDDKGKDHEFFGWFEIKKD